MPLIPIIQRQQSVPAESPNAPMNIASAGVVGTAIKGLGGDIYDLATKAQEERDKLDLINISNDYEKKNTDELIKIEKETLPKDGDGLTRRMEGNLTLNRDKYLAENVSPRLQPKALGILSEINNRSFKALANHEIHLNNVYKKQTIEDTISVATANMVRNPTDINNVVTVMTTTHAKLEALGVSDADIGKTTTTQLSRVIETNITNGQLSTARSMINLFKGQLDEYGLRDTLNGMIKTKMRNDEFDAAGKTDKRVEAEIFRDIKNGIVDPSVIEKQIIDVTGKSITTATARQLFSDLNRQVSPEMRANQKSVMGEFKKLEKNKILTSAERIEQELAFGAWVRKNPTVDPKTGYYDKIMEPVITGWFDLVFDGVNPQKRLKEMKEAGDIPQREKQTRNAPTQTDLEYTAKKHGLTVDQVKAKLGIK